MDKLRINFTNGSLSSDLNDVVEKCKEFGESQELNNLNFQDGYPLSANDLNIIIRFLNSLLPDNKKLTEFDCGQQLCINQLDDIVNSINRLIIDEEDDDVYELIVEEKSSLYISGEGGQCLFKASILKNGIPWSSNVSCDYNNKSEVIYAYYKDFILNIPENTTENVKEIPVTFSCEYGEKTVIIYQDVKEDDNQEDVYKIKIQDDGKILDWVKYENFPIIVQVTKNGFSVSDRNEFLFGLVDNSLTHITYKHYEYKNDLYYFYYDIDANNSNSLRTFHFEGKYQDSTDRIEKIQGKRINIITSSDVGIDAYTFHPDLTSDETEMVIHGDALLDGEYQEEVIFETIDFQKEILWQRHLSSGSNIASLYISPNSSANSRQVSIVAKYNHDGETYISDPVIFTQQGKLPDTDKYYIIQWKCNLENATVNNKNSDVIQIKEGNNWSGTIYSPDGYSIKSITDNGNEISINNSINVTNIQENHNFIVTLYQTEFREILTVVPSSTNVKVGDIINFTINSNSYQQAYNYAKLKFSESDEPFYNLRVEGNTMNILETDEGIDISDSKNTKIAGYFIAPYEKLNAYTSVPSQIKYSLKAIGEGEIKLSFASYYGPDDYIGATTQCTINVSEADPKYRLVLNPNVIELKVNGNPGQVQATLEGYKTGTSNWQLLWDNFESTVGIETHDCIIYPADTPGTREKEFTAIKDGKEYKATLIVITHDEEDPIGNLHYVTYWDVGEGHSTRYDYYTNPDAIVLGRTYFYSGDNIHTYQWMTESEAKYNALARGRDRSSYTLRGWDRDDFTKMPDRDFSVGAIWDEGDVPPEEPNTYTITWSGNNFTMTNMNPVISNGDSLEEGSTWSGKVTPNTGYKIDNIVVVGAEKGNDGTVSVNNLNKNVTITVTTSPIQYTISWSGQHITTSNMNPVISSGGKLNYNSTWTATFVPEDGYQIDNITYTGQNITKSGNKISISSLKSNVSIVITTSQIPENSYTISWTGEHASVNKTLPITLVEHSQWSGIFTADEGYKIDSIKVNGQLQSGNTVNIEDLTENINIVVVTSKIQFTISWSGNNVNISSNSTSPITKDYGSTWSGTFVPSEGYEITNIQTTGNNITKQDNTVTVSNLTSNVTITITTSKVQIPKYSISWTGEHINMINMNPVISNGGKVDHGSNWTGTVEVDEGYQIDNIQTSKGSVSENTITIDNITENITINISTSEIIPVTLNVQDITVKVGNSEYLFTKWALSDSSVQVDNVQYEIADTSIAEVTGDENWEEVSGKVIGETTYTVTVNGTISGTGTITVIGIFEGYEYSWFTDNRIPAFDIFGNRAIYKNNQRSAIPLNSPDGDYTDTVVYFDGYNENKFTIQTNSEEELQYIINNMQISENWITVTSSGFNLLVNVEPWYEKIEELKNYAHYDEVVGSNVIVGVFNPPNHSSFTVNPNGQYNNRIANIILTSSDGSQLTIPIVQSCVYGGNCFGGGDSYNMTLTSENIWKSVDWYGQEGTTFSRRREFSINVNPANAPAFAVYHPYESVQGITGLPDLLVLDYNDTPYDSSFSKLFTQDIYH